MHRSTGLASRVRNVVTTALVVAFVAGAGFSRAEAIVYDGAPDLALTSALVAAGGGPEHFSSLKLYTVLAGSSSTAETKKLTNQFGAADVTDAFAVFDFAIADVVRVATAKHIALPPPVPAPTDAKALATALYQAGNTTRGGWDVGYMLERLITHPIHHVIMHDIDAKFGAKKNGSFHMVLAQMMDDLAVAYSTAR